MTRIPMTSVIVGAAAGLVVAAGLVWTIHRPAASSDEGTRDALVRMMRDGPPAGVWRIEEPTETRVRTIVPDPDDPALCLYWMEDDGYARVHACPKEIAVKRWLPGDPDLFLRNYRPAGPPREGVLGDRRVRFVRWTLLGCDTCAARVVAKDSTTGEVVRVEDRAYDERPIHAVEIQDAGVHPSKVLDTPKADLAVARGKAREKLAQAIASNETHTWPAFVASVPFDVYEPARVPRGFERVAFTRQRYVPRGSVTNRELDLVTQVYGDGMATMILLLGRTADMNELEEIARSASPANGGSCPPITAPDQPIEDAPTIYCRANACRTVLRREFPDSDVWAALVTFNERPRDVYVETMQSLVKPPKP